MVGENIFTPITEKHNNWLERKIYIYKVINHGFGSDITP